MLPILTPLVGTISPILSLIDTLQNMGGIGLLMVTSDDPLSSWSGLLLNMGMGGLMLTLMLIGRLVPKSVLDEMRSDRDQWKKAYEILRDEKQATLDRDGVMLHILEEIKEAAKGKTVL